MGSPPEERDYSNKTQDIIQDELDQLIENAKFVASKNA
jgi:hypothetical protein